MKNRLWVVEVAFQDVDPEYGYGDWAPSCAAGLTREDAREEARQFHRNNDDVLTRVRCYRPTPPTRGEAQGEG